MGVNHMKAQIKFLAAGVAAILLSGCCSTRHCEGAGNAVKKYQLQPNSMRETLEIRADLAQTNIDMLVLSGGGSHGAWGAGVLRGWRDNPVNPRPQKFRIVTGVSTGALLATYAFLGETNDDELVGRVYTTVKTSDIYRKKFLLFALFSDSLTSSSPLAHTIKKHISQETVDRVARAGREEHRQLFVGTANLDTGKLVVWNLTAIAMDESNPKRLDLYRRVVLASASVPILVQPVKIDGNLYADGGVRAQLFFERDFFPALRRARQLPAAGNAPPNLTFHVIVNGKIGVEPTCVSDCLKAIATRTSEMLLDANAIGDLYHIDYVRDLIGFGKIRLCYIPSDLPVTSSDVFDTEMMKKLYAAGVEYGKTKAQWDDHIPDPDAGR
jgi:predicted acylesterase/phospholipase RssA